MLKLADLPHFVVEKIEQENSDFLLHGQVNTRKVSAGRAWLYVSRDKSIIGDLALAHAPGERDTFVAPDWAMNDAAQIGASLSILGGGWNADQIARILDALHVWQRQRFAASDATEFSQPGLAHGWVGTTKSGNPIPADAQARGVRPGGWDHEHCDLCDQKIGLGGQDFGYRDPGDHWLCERCFHAYAEKHDLSFLRWNDAAGHSV